MQWVQGPTHNHLWIWFSHSVFLFRTLKFVTLFFLTTNLFYLRLHFLVDRLLLFLKLDGLDTLQQVQRVSLLQLILYIA